MLGSPALLRHPVPRTFCAAARKAAEQAIANAQRSAGELAAAEAAAAKVRDDHPDPATSLEVPDVPIERAPLRFPLGAIVECRLGQDKWARGRVIGHYYREKSWPPERRVPYQVQIEGEGAPKIYAPVDEDGCIRTTLRFALGDRVECYMGDGLWAPGSVAAQYHREPSWPPEQWAPYQVILDDGPHGRSVAIYAPEDSDDCIRHPPVWPWPGAAKPG